MRTRIACPTCGAAWRRSVARFCGACGELLPTRPGASSRSPRGWPAIVVATAAAMALLAAAATLGGDADRATPPAGPGELVVDLPDIPAPTEAVDEPHEDEIVRPRSIVTRPFVCTPEGCEAWRHELPPSSRAAAAEDVIAVQAASELYALDPATGERRWAVQLHGPNPGRDGTFSVAFAPPIHLAADAGLVAVSGQPGWVQLRDARDGELLWSVRVGGPVHQLALADDEVVLAAGRGRSAADAARVIALEVGSGDVLSERAVTGTPVVGGGPPSAEPPDGAWLRHLPDRGLDVIAPDGDWMVTIHGHAPQLLYGDPPVVLEQRGLMGLRLPGQEVVEGPVAGDG